MISDSSKAVYPITPVPKPRMTRRDRWGTNKRPAVERYHRFCDEVRELGLSLPDAGAHVTFLVPMPKSWSKSKREAMAGTPHQQRPDVDNFEKALLDAIFEDDSRVWDIRTTKRWAEIGAIEICHIGVDS